MIKENAIERIVGFVLRIIEKKAMRRLLKQ